MMPFVLSPAPSVGQNAVWVTALDWQTPSHLHQGHLPSLPTGCKQVPPPLTTPLPMKIWSAYWDQICVLAKRALSNSCNDYISDEYLEGESIANTLCIPQSTTSLWIWSDISYYDNSWPQTCRSRGPQPFQWKPVIINSSIPTDSHFTFPCSIEHPTPSPPHPATFPRVQCCETGLWLHVHTQNSLPPIASWYVRRVLCPPFLLLYIPETKTKSPGSISAGSE